MQHVSVIMTVRNDPIGCALTLRSLSKQSRLANEIVVVDGGSTDSTVAVIKRLAQADPRIRCVESSRGNIAQGRNLAARVATGDVLACIDGGCRAEVDWLERLVRPFDVDPEVEFVAGFYRVAPQSLLETVVGLATMRGQLEPINLKSFNPSARSMACTKSLWLRVGGWPEWLSFSEDTLFDHKVRALGAKWYVAEDAVVYWRPRTSLRAVGRQFYNYGTGRGHTQIGAKSFAYNLRNIALCAMSAALCAVTIWACVALAAMLVYFYIWTFHGKAVRVARSVGRARAYPLCLLIMWVVLFTNLAGYLVGSWQRWRDRDRFRGRMEAYMAAA